MTRAQLKALARGSSQRRGAGMGGPGQGAGGLAAETPDKATGFVPERSRAMVSAGRHLLEMETERRAPEAGPVTVEQTEALQALRQGAAEAMLRESVPQAYHDSIQRYFDDLAHGKK
ncbi:MAG: hypothetical protein R3F56_25745 [Planctomycetota bacterium]